MRQGDVATLHRVERRVLGVISHAHLVVYLDREDRRGAKGEQEESPYDTIFVFWKMEKDRIEVFTIHLT